MGFSLNTAHENQETNKRVCHMMHKASVVHMPLHVEVLATPYMCQKLAKNAHHDLSRDFRITQIIYRSY
jgi:hypothetical protein